jgi:hypothetical protein
MAIDDNAEQGKKRWSARVTASSHALDLPPGLFSIRDPAAIAAALLEAAERSAGRKRSAYGSAMAMLCFYINRAGRRLAPEQRQRLESAKAELRRLAQRNG